MRFWYFTHKILGGFFIGLILGGIAVTVFASIIALCLYFLV